jgi:hypothetical protein
MKMVLGERLAAATISSLDNLVVILTSRHKFKLVKFRAAPHGPRNAKGDYVISLTRHDQVTALTQIVQRPEPPPTPEEPEEPESSVENDMQSAPELTTHSPGTNGGSEESA